MFYRGAKKVLVIGAGLAGTEASYFLAERGVKVVLLEAKGLKLNPAQKITTAAELVCTNSLKSLNPEAAHGILKYEMRGLNSIVLKIAEATSVPAGDALAVDRALFSQQIQSALEGHENIEFITEEVVDPLQAAQKYNCDYTIVATGPLTNETLEKWIIDKVSQADFYFYDAIAPVVDGDSLDYSKLYYKDRHKEAVEGCEADYLNAPMDKEQYEAFIAELVKADKVPAANFEELKYFEACLPIDTMAMRGKDTPRFGCMKPIGLSSPAGESYYAVVQLRRENLLGSAFNLVGFQTRLTFKEQLRVFRMIPGLENASFNHLGSVHRNSFLNARKLLNFDLSSKEFPNLYFAGQMTGVEGYTESASMGLYTGLQVLRKLNDLEGLKFPVETAIGALINYLMTMPKPSPSNINFGLLPQIPLTKEQRKDRKNRKRVKKSLGALRARESFDRFLEEYKL